MTVGMLAMFGLGVGTAFPAGWAFARLQLARHSALLNESVRDGTARTYSTTADGRDARRYAPERYAEENGG
jgi:hypothetical protein